MYWKRPIFQLTLYHCYIVYNYKSSSDMKKFNKDIISIHKEFERKKNRHIGDEIDKDIE